jgi:hypothetical protein
MTTVKKPKDFEFDYSSFKLDLIRMSPEKFMNLPAFFRNRDVESRISKMVKRLKNGPLPTHLIVAVGKSTKDIYDSHGVLKYKKGQYFRLDGHTRTDAWKVKPELIPNVDLIVLVYEVDTYEYSMKVYNDIDSSESAETSNEKVTGLLREREYMAKSLRIKQGKFKTAVNNAARYLKAEDGSCLCDKKYNYRFDIKLDFFWKELTNIDKIGIDNIERYSGNVLTSLLLIAKKYGSTSRQFKTLVENYTEGTTTVNNSSSVDGVHYVYNNLYPQHKDVWTQTGFSNSFGIISKILYCFDMFMKNEPISKRSNFPKDKVLKQLYINFIK